jgi:FkbM family methyltransferase
MISYAQNGEDAVLARLFTSNHGYYVDLGAGHPVLDSTTKHFSDRGWRGLNIEPLPEHFVLLQAYRPRDVCRQVAVSDRAGTVTLHIDPAETRGCSTTIPSYVAPMSGGLPVDTIEVEAVRLTDLLHEHGVETIDLLKMDVEGAEAAIINDTDWDAIRPRALVIEATLPNTATPTHEQWESVLLAAGYVCTLFDGLNRFYAQADDTEAITALSVPVNVRDSALPYQFVRRVQELEEELRNERAVCRHSDSPSAPGADVRLAALSREISATAREARLLARAADPGGRVLGEHP